MAVDINNTERFTGAILAVAVDSFAGEVHLLLDGTRACTVYFRRFPHEPLREVLTMPSAVLPRIVEYLKTVSEMTPNAAECDAEFPQQIVFWHSHVAFVYPWHFHEPRGHLLLKRQGSLSDADKVRAESQSYPTSPNDVARILAHFSRVLTAWWNKGDYEGVAFLAGEVLRLSPGDENAYAFLKTAYQFQKDWGSYLVAARKLTFYFPQKAKAYSDVAFGFFQTGQYALAEHECRTALSLEPTNALYHHTLGNCLQAQAKFTEAIAAYNHSAAMVGSNAALCSLSIAECYTALRNTLLARKYAQFALTSADPKITAKAHALLQNLSLTRC